MTDHMSQPTPFPWQTTRPARLIEKLNQIEEMVLLANQRGQRDVAKSWKQEAYELLDEIIANITEK